MLLRRRSGARSGEVGTGFPKKIMVKKSQSGMTIRRKVIALQTLVVRSAATRRVSGQCFALPGEP
jgi:hypothetical protein